MLVDNQILTYFFAKQELTVGNIGMECQKLQLSQKLC